MKVKVVGVGGAFSEELFNQCFALEEDGETILFDCGKQTIPFALKQANIKVSEVAGVIVTHGHDDHIGSLNELGLRRYDFVTQPKPKHWTQNKSKIPPPFLVMNENVHKDLWNKALSLGLETMEGFVASLDTYFDVRVIPDNTTWEWKGNKFEFIQQIHVMTGSSVMFCYGAFITTKSGKKVFLTSDCQYFQPRQILGFYRDADFIITDCETFGSNFKFPEGTLVYTNPNTKEVSPWPTKENDPDGMVALELQTLGLEPIEWEVLKMMSGVHATYPEWAGYKSGRASVLPLEYRGKTWFSHYGDHVIHNKDGFGNTLDWDAQAKKDGFAGFVRLGQEFEF